ncbi:MAG: TIGR03668 family PPOX class F420-dependent oxidoreductase [Candidatus Rokubacteria bacterium]|nr:TIGR03668 family PPOX class F420-dependent oxidoreductase [Candidatus Rokubacteria bacterium]
MDTLRHARVGRLATADAGGQPLVVPVCYAFDGETIYSAVDAKPKRTRDLRRLRNVRDNPRVSLVIDEYDEDWTRLSWVIVEGAADVLEDGAAFTRAIDLLLAKYPQYRAMGLARESGAVVRIRPARILTWRFAG